MEKKGEGIGKLLEMVSSPIWPLFWYCRIGEGIGKLLKLL
jgi:hypothetical protein